MYCGNCGKELPEGSKFCSGCGQPLKMAAPNLNQPAQSFEPVKSPGKKLQYKHIGMIACAVVVIIAILVGVTFTRGGSAEQVTKKYMEALCDLDFKRMSKYSVIDIEKILSLSLLFSSEYSDQDAVAEKLKDKIKSEFGDDYKISVEVYDKTEISKEEISSAMDSITDVLSYADVDLSNVVDVSGIKEACYVGTEITISGELSTETQALQVLCIKKGGNWLVVFPEEADGSYF